MSTATDEIEITELALDSSIYCEGAYQSLFRPAWIRCVNVAEYRISFKCIRCGNCTAFVCKQCLKLIRTGTGIHMQCSNSVAFTGML